MVKDETAAPKRRNRSVTVADAVAGVLDPAMRKRGFASRDVVTHWATIAPAPYGEVAQPDKLIWPRGAGAGRAEGATLVLRCAPGHALAAQHEADRIASAVNRYFGFFLVKAVRLSAEPFTPGSAPPEQNRRQPSQSVVAKVGGQVASVEDEGLREALRMLGLALASEPNAAER
jgi:hypothetical protein